MGPKGRSRAASRRIWRVCGATPCRCRARATSPRIFVQATCLRAIERADQFQPGTRLDRWLFAILRSIWLNESRARRVRAGQGVLDAGEALSVDGAHEIETNISAAQVLRAIGALPSAQRETVLLVYVEGYSYREAAELLGVPIGTIMSRLATARATLAGPRETKDG